MKKIIFVLLAAGLAVTAACSAAAAVETEASNQAGPVTIGGAVRKTGPSTWAVIIDTAHVPAGIGDVDCDPVTGDLTVHYTTPITHLVRAWAESDETFSRAGIVVGASVGLDAMLLRFTRGDVPVPCISDDLGSPSGNVWVGADGIIR